MTRFNDHQPRKRFGQHFLHDPHVVRRIVEAFDPQPGQPIVEIGPGLGVLTRELLTRTDHLHVVELDRDLAARLQETYGASSPLTVHQADALRFDFCRLASGHDKLRIVGNLPYNISTPLLFHLLDQSDCISDMLFMLQKEVVDRMVAPPGGKDYGRLSVMLQWRCRLQKLFDVGPGAFNPPPKVDSSIVRLIPLGERPQVVSPTLFAQVVQTAFSQRRKTLRNTLKSLADAQAFQQAGIDPSRRAETLSLEEFVALSNAISSHED